MNMPFLSKKQRCDHCGQTDFRYKKVKDLLCWVLTRIWNGDIELCREILRENCTLDSWWNDHQRAYSAEMVRNLEEEKRQRKIKVALSKLTPEERDLLQIKLK